MKKIAYFLAASAILALTSCEDDKTPVFETPSQPVGSFVMNTPPYAAQELVLTEDGSLQFGVYKQPEYGAPMVVTYRAIVALNEADLDPAGENFATLTRTIRPSSTATSLNLEFAQADLSTAINELHGYDFDTFVDGAPETVYVRMKAYIDHFEETTACYSNIITLDKVKTFNSFQPPVYAFAYFDNTNTNWPDVYVWAWNDADNCTAAGSWPGDKISLDPETGYYKWSGPAGKVPTKIIFSNNDGSQTADLNFYDRAVYDFNGSIVYTAYYTNPAGWPAPAVWAWSSSENCTASGNWPGDPMFQNANGDWQWNSPVGKKPEFIIFNNNGAGEQTADISWNVEDENGKTFTDGKK